MTDVGILAVHVSAVEGLLHRATRRALLSPRIDPASWRGPAYGAYEAAAEELAGDLRHAVACLQDARIALSQELARATA